MENKGFFCPSQPPYIVPCRNSLSKSQKKIVEERVTAIQSEVPICVAVMKNNNVGVAQKWMLVSSISFFGLELYHSMLLRLQFIHVKPTL
ncbi:hypothetical protein PR202_ga12692 [Eleusine coracana subsp. coracana]|uniref:Uncharacterized protein n=1 Tax=Eleusine coracana subsp. coracana TaxID=191504 RepID=A0AAV5CCU7_ELECO|nr:hypothetical protein PR202_ga12692 [Eleusine coracana subsp. coracana]